MAKKNKMGGPGKPKKGKKAKKSMVSKLPLGSTVDAAAILKSKGVNVNITRDFPLPSSNDLFRNSNPEANAPKRSFKPNKYDAESYARRARAQKKEFHKHRKNFSADKRAIKFAREGNSVTDLKPSDLPRLQAKATRDSTMMSNSFKRMKEFQKISKKNMPKGSHMVNGKVVPKGSVMINGKIQKSRESRRIF
jgi:hypothetical protein